VCTAPALFRAFLRLGAVAFGGLGAALALLQKDLVERRGWLEASDLKDALAFTKPLPGSTVVQIVAFLGWRIRGWIGALVATAGFLLPSIALMVAAAAGAAALPSAPWVDGLLAGVQIAVVGLLASAMWKLARSEAKELILTVVLALGLTLGFFVNAAIVVVGAGLLGMLTTLRKKADG
jgi:chromate transporter